MKDAVSVTADFALRGTTIDLIFKITDPQKLVRDTLVPGTFAGTEAKRADDLWKTTCFEAFWGLRGTKEYWEFNISPSGKKWNCYKFEDYRDPSPAEQSLDYQLKEVTITEDTIECSLRGKTVLPSVEASLCVILKTESGLHYFSKEHVEKRPNFHSRDSFVLFVRQP